MWGNCDSLSYPMFRILFCMYSHFCQVCFLMILYYVFLVYCSITYVSYSPLLFFVFKTIQFYGFCFVHPFLHCPLFHDYFSRILPYFDFGFVHSGHQTTFYISNFFPLPYLLFSKEDWAVFAHFICFVVCLLLFCAVCHVLFAHTALDKKWKYPWSRDPPRLLKGSRPSSAEKKLWSTKCCCTKIPRILWVWNKLQKQLCLFT